MVAPLRAGELAHGREGFRPLSRADYTVAMLQIVSALNWVQAVILFIFGGYIAMSGLGTNGSTFGLFVALGCFLLGAPFAYLGTVIEKGRGRGLQTAFAVLAFFAFPVGTLFSVFSLYAIWFSPLSERFEAGGAAPRRVKARDARVDSALAEADEDEIDDDWPEDEPAYAYARRMADAGMRAGALRARLRNGGVDPDDVETLLGAVGLVRPGGERAQRDARPAAPARRPRPAPKGR